MNDNIITAAVLTMAYYLSESIKHPWLKCSVKIIIIFTAIAILSLASTDIPKTLFSATLGYIIGSGIITLIRGQHA